MLASHIKAALAVALFFLSPATLLADEITLANWDRLTGTVERLKDDTLTFKTDYAGALTIKWSDIHTLRTDSKVRIQLADSSYFRSEITPSEQPGVLLVGGEAPSRKIATSEITAINPETPPNGVLYSGRANLGAAVSDGNTQQSTFATDGEVVARAAKDRLTLGWNIDQENTEGEKTADYVAGHAKYDYFVSKKWYILANLTGEKDEIKAMDLRRDMGLGAGYQVLETKTEKLSFETGLSHISLDFEQDTTRSFLAEWWAVNASFDFKGIELFHQHDGSVSMEDTDRILIRSLSGIRMPVYKQFNTTLQVKWDWENMPQPGIRNSDVDYMLTFGVKF